MQRYFAKEKIDNKFILNEDDIYHIKTVMRMREKDKIHVVYNESAYLCCLENVNKNIEICIVEPLKKNIEKMPKIVLILPLLKEQKMDLIIQKATELGVHKIIPIDTERSIIKLKNGKDSKKIERWQRIAKEASEQSYRIDIPLIDDIKTIKKLTDLNGLKMLCSTVEKENNLHFILKKNLNYDIINIVIGPEGGLSFKEEKELQELGFISITLGNRIMRVETVPMFILSILNYEYME